MPEFIHYALLLFKNGTVDPALSDTCPGYLYGTFTKQIYAQNATKGVAFARKCVGKLTGSRGSCTGGKVRIHLFTAAHPASCSVQP